MCSNKFYINDEFYYTIKRIKNRIIYIPCDELKAKQRFFLNAIKWLYTYKADTLYSAKIHSGKKWILKMDIKHFYDSVPSHEIQRVVSKVCRRINQNYNSFSYLSLVTINGKLPTGAPTSSHIANACFKRIDKEIMSVSSSFGIDYTRYVDDLTFSSYCKETLEIVEKRVTALLAFYGYKINPKKTKYISDNKQQNILGLVVNNYRVRLSKNFKRNIRAMLHSYAVYLCNSNIKDTKHLAWDTKKEQQLSGYISYICHVDSPFYVQLKRYAQKLEQKYLVIIPYFGH
jgi:hypothetical protein